MKHEFHVVPGAVTRAILDEAPLHSIDSVAAAYLAHHAGRTVNPDSYFLRFPAQPANRIIALPASIGGADDEGVSGIKWIASFPDNIKSGLARASAALLLNDNRTGYPYACLEASHISSARTAASAVLAARWMGDGTRRAASIAFVGAGVISRSILDLFVADGWRFDQLGVHDPDPASAGALAHHGAALGAAPSCVAYTREQALAADVLVFATNAGAPHVLPPAALRAGQIVLHISLRDIAPELLHDSWNMVDDVEHSLKANTSLHLAEQQLGRRDFVRGTLAQLMLGEIAVDRTRPLVFSPFGLGVLDLALGKRIFEQARARQMTTPIPQFFHGTQRW